MSDTPRTDAYCKQILEDGLGLEYAATELQHFAEKLERELVDARAELAEAKAKITMLKGEAQYGVDLFQRVIHAERELEETKEQLRLCNVDQLTTAAELADAQEELNDRRKFSYAVELALEGFKGDYIEIIKSLVEDAKRYRWLRVQILDAITINDAAMEGK